MDPFYVLQKTHSLNINDIRTLKSRFCWTSPISNNLFIGQLFPGSIYNMIVGAPCIRKDIEGISLNTFYQIFMPMYVAKQQNVPCTIFLGIQEEIILQPKLEKIYKHIGTKLEHAIRKLAYDIDISVLVINTSDPHYNQIIEKGISELRISLTTNKSTQLFNLRDSTNHNKKTHSQLRVIASKRVIGCNTAYLLNQLIGEYKFLITEDIGQHKCLLTANLIRNDDKILPNFLGFLPLPSIDGYSDMFQANRKNRLIINDKESHYHTAISSAPDWVKEVYLELATIINDGVTDGGTTDDPILIRQMMKKIGTYFS